MLTRAAVLGLCLAVSVLVSGCSEGPRDTTQPRASESSSVTSPEPEVTPTREDPIEWRIAMGKQFYSGDTAVCDKFTPNALRMFPPTRDRAACVDFVASQRGKHTDEDLDAIFRDTEYTVVSDSSKRVVTQSVYKGDRTGVELTELISRGDEGSWFVYDIRKAANAR